VMADEDANALRAQPLDVGTVLLIAALDGMAFGAQDLGDRAHADAANADDVEGARFARDLHDRVYPFFSPAPATAACLHEVTSDSPPALQSTLRRDRR